MAVQWMWLKFSLLFLITFSTIMVCQADSITDLVNGIVAKLACTEAHLSDNDAACQKWYDSDTGPPSDLMHCPPLLEEVKLDARFQQDDSTGEKLQFYHPGAEYSFRQKVPNPSGSGQQCVYKNGSLLVGPPGGGTADAVSPQKSGLGHWRQDVVPWCHCCAYSKAPDSCAKYYEKRPSDPGTEYVAP